MDWGVELPRLPAGPWYVDGSLDAAAIAAFRGWLADPVLAWSLGRTPSEFSEADVRALHASHDRRTSWMGFARPVAGGPPAAYVSLRVAPSNGVARLDMLVGDRDVVAWQVQDEVLRALGGWGFEVQNVRKVVFDVRADNAATVRWLSGRATLEGRLRGELVLPDGRVVDNLRFGLMADEWRSLMGRLPPSAPAPIARRRPRSPDRIGRS